jgi:hypothetical protein
MDVVAAVSEVVVAGSAPFNNAPKIIGGRYDLSSK